MKETLKLVNRMVKNGVIEHYAIGGAVAAIYYLEPFATADLDIFVQVKTSGGQLMTIQAMRKYPDIKETIKKKERQRRSLAELPFEKKIEIVFKLRERRMFVKSGRVIKSRSSKAKSH